jgi:hypothetical protein
MTNKRALIALAASLGVPQPNSARIRMPRLSLEERTVPRLPKPKIDTSPPSYGLMGSVVPFITSTETG